MCAYVAEQNKEKEKQQEEGQEMEQEQLRKKKMANTGGEATLEKNVNNIDTNKYDLEFEIDPLFQQTSAKFDEGGAKGLLLNNLAVRLGWPYIADQRQPRAGPGLRADQRQPAANQ